MKDERLPPDKPASQQKPEQHKDTPSKPISHGQMLLEITAISGEYPAENIHRLIPSRNYAQKVVSALIYDKFIKLINKGGIKGYRLELKGKKKLVAENPARFKDYLEGTVDTNKLRSDHARRLRLHSAAVVYTLLQNAGVRIYKDTKPQIYMTAEPANPSQSVDEVPERKTALNEMNFNTFGNNGEQAVITIPCFYSSREQKGDDDLAIRGSRAAGILLTPTHFYAIYYTGGVESRWSDKVENRYKVKNHDYISRKLFYSQYKGEAPVGIMVGARFESLEKYLDAKINPITNSNFVINTYKPFYFITNDANGEVQLKLLCDNAKMVALRNALSQGLLPRDTKYPIEHDALTEDGNPVLFCCLLDIPRLVRFKNGITAHKKAGRVIGFDFQKEVLARFLGAEVTFTSLSMEKCTKLFFSDG